MSRGLLAASVAKVSRVEGSFTLRSGTTATAYFDKYRFESDPALLASIAEHMAPLLPSDADVLAGLELGGVPIATALSLHTGLPVAFVRKQAKTYGTCRLVEGAEIQDQRLCIVEDVVTTAGQVVESCAALRELGGIVSHALCVVDRQAGGSEALRQIGVDLHPLFLRSELDDPSAV